MTDPLKARLPCLEHGNMGDCLEPACGEVHSGRMEHPFRRCRCPGGREVLLVPTKPDYEAAQLVKISDPCDMDGQRDQANEWVTPRDIQAIVDAAVGDTWTIQEVDNA